MKKWQEDRNYRKIKDENGNVVSNIITVKGVDIVVAKEVYLAYAQMNWRERYLEQESLREKPLSLEQMTEGLVPDYIHAEPVRSAEAQLIEQENATDLENQKQTLLLALLSLSDADRELIIALFMDGVSAAQYARNHGVSDMAIRKRRNRILKKLKKFF
jgi:RNA polymerase sigma factor (sigma-70 family)